MLSFHCTLNYTPTRLAPDIARNYCANRCITGNQLPCNHHPHHGNTWDSGIFLTIYMIRNRKSKHGSPHALWIVVCLVMIITPTLATTYYIPTISGEDYMIDGMKWLGENGDHTEYVVGYQLRPLEIYTNMTWNSMFNPGKRCGNF